MKYSILLTVLIAIITCLHAANAGLNHNNNDLDPDLYDLDAVLHKLSHMTNNSPNTRLVDPSRIKPSRNDDKPTLPITFYPFSATNGLLQIALAVDKTVFDQVDNTYELSLTFAGFRAIKDLDVHTTRAEYNAAGELITSQTQHHVMGTKQRSFKGKISFASDVKPKEHQLLSPTDEATIKYSMRIDIPVDTITSPTITANMTSVSNPNNTIIDPTGYHQEPLKPFASEIVLNKTLNKIDPKDQFHNFNITMNLITAPVTAAASFIVSETFQNDQFFAIPSFVGPAPCKINDSPIEAVVVDGKLVLPNDTVLLYGTNLTLTCQGIGLRCQGGPDDGSSYVFQFDTADAEPQNYLSQVYTEPLRSKWGFILTLIAIGGCFDVVLIFFVLFCNKLLCFKKREGNLSLNDGGAYQKID